MLFKMCFSISEPSNETFINRLITSNNDFKGLYRFSLLNSWLGFITQISFVSKVKLTVSILNFVCFENIKLLLFDRFSLILVELLLKVKATSKVKS